MGLSWKGTFTLEPYLSWSGLRNVRVAENEGAGSHPAASGRREHTDPAAGCTPRCGGKGPRRAWGTASGALHVWRAQRDERKARVCPAPRCAQGNLGALRGDSPQTGFYRAPQQERKRGVSIALGSSARALRHLQGHLGARRRARECNCCPAQSVGSLRFSRSA